MNLHLVLGWGIEEEIVSQGHMGAICKEILKVVVCVKTGGSRVGGPELCI